MVISEVVAPPVPSPIPSAEYGRGNRRWYFGNTHLRSTLGPKGLAAGLRAFLASHFRAAWCTVAHGACLEENSRQIAASADRGRLARSASKSPKCAAPAMNIAVPTGAKMRARRPRSKMARRIAVPRIAFHALYRPDQNAASILVRA